MKLNAKQLRRSKPQRQDIPQKRMPIVLVLDNIQDTFNIGSFFRLADAVNAEKIYLCGKVVTPPNIKIHRASIGTWKWMPWEQKTDIVSLIKKLKKSGYFIVAAEQGKNSIPYHKVGYKFPMALIVGNETMGINQEALKEANAIAEIPLLGINKSLNVLVAASAIIYQALSPKINKFVPIGIGINKFVSD